MLSRYQFCRNYWHYSSFKHCSTNNRSNSLHIRSNVHSSYFHHAILFTRSFRICAFESVRSQRKLLSSPLDNRGANTNLPVSLWSFQPHAKMWLPFTATQILRKRTEKQRMPSVLPEEYRTLRTISTALFKLARSWTSLYCGLCEKHTNEKKRHG